MKNEKLHKVIDVVIKVINIVSILAQALKATFPADSPVQKVVEVDDNVDSEIIRKFLNEGAKQ